MKIIYYSPHPTHDIVTEVGYATHQRETIIALQNLGAEVIPVIMGGTTFEEVPYKDGKAITHSGLKGFIKKIIPRYVWVTLKDFRLMMHDKRAAKRLEAAIIKYQPDLVYERSEYLQDASVAVVKKYKVKHYIEVNSPFVQEMKHLEGNSLWTSLGHYKEKRKYKSADKVWVVSSALKEFLVNRYQIESSKIIISPNRINKEEFERIIPLPFDIKTSQKQVVIGFVGSILPHHDVEDLIEAFGIVKRKNTDALLCIVGGGSLLDSLKQKVKEQQLTECVLFIGKVPHHQVPAYIKQMDICVMPGSNWYGSPIKIFEYGILGKAVIAPNNGPVNDVMEDLKDGILIEKGAEAIANAIIQLIENPDLRQSIGQHFKSKIEAEYQWEHAAKMILEQY
jgi:glycosyltransferase involved in cell wall biosynthesis